MSGLCVNNRNLDFVINEATQQSICGFWVRSASGKECSLLRHLAGVSLFKDFQIRKPDVNAHVASTIATHVGRCVGPDGPSDPPVNFSVLGSQVTIGPLHDFDAITEPSGDFVN